MKRGKPFEKGMTPWNKGIYKSKPICVDCEKQLNDRRSLRCNKCNGIKTGFKKGCVSLTKGKKIWINKIHPFLGKKLSETHRKNLSLAKLGKTGKESNNWQGGKTSINFLERRKFQREIQKKVFERDDYTCQLCSVRGVDMQVDHIQAWSEYVELRFNIDNCRTLCAKCHYQITFGKPMPPTVRAWGHNFFKGGKQL